MIEDGTIEFQNHSYNLHSNTNGRNGSMKRYGETFETYTNIFTSDTMKLQNEFKENTGYLPNTYTYPFGAVSKGTTNILKEMGFKASLSCTSGVNIITKDKDCLFLLKRNNRPSFISSEKFFEKILK
jgi:peptidoglycan/xylan/chitin deacetylase (PgdA/CDA1 family)